MLATAVSEAFDNPEWLFEVKWDGFRALAFINSGKVSLKSRSDQNMNAKFSFIVQQLEKIEGQVVLDGELVVVDEKGRASFQGIQDYQNNPKAKLLYYVFDLLFKDGQDLRELPLQKRKAILKQYLDECNLPSIRFSDHVIAKGKPLYKEAVKQKLEGIMAKKISSPYVSRRSSDWVKIKTVQRQEVVIGGFTAPRGSRQKFGALLVGLYNSEGEFIYCGHVGGGFNAEMLANVSKKLQSLIRLKPSFKIAPKPNAPATWVKPELVCEVAFTEWTKDKIMRHPVFQGLRTDKSAAEVFKEKVVAPPSQISNSAKIPLTHTDKIYWPKEKYTKGDLLAYYEEISPYILPYLKNRPIILHRFPEGIEGIEFYQKDLGIKHPNWIKTCLITHESQKLDHYLLINDLRSLLYAVNLGSIDLHPFLSRYNNLDSPDWCVIDLDPHDIAFSKIIEVALLIHELLTEIDVKHYCKTSGGNGLHIIIPLNKSYSYEQSRQFAEIICHFIHAKTQKITSLERVPSKRPKKIYLDCLQNRIGQSIVATYAVRPRPGANVSTPLSWDEVNSDLDPKQFNIKTVPQRLEKVGDLLKNALKDKNDLKKALALMQDN
jgi:bifunctional non-homologous end joining protein LigD